MNLKKLKTTRLFYNKFPYKLVVAFKGGYLVRIYNIKGFKSLFNDKDHASIQRMSFSKEDTFRFLDIISPYLTDNQIQIRYEGNKASIFTKDNLIFKELQQKLFYCLLSITEPENEESLNTFLNSQKIRLVDSYPHGKFKYKVSFKKLSPKLKETLLNWHNTYPTNTVQFSKTTVKNLSISQHRYWESNYVYLADDKMLTMLHLVVGTNIRKVEQFVLNSSINTSSQNQVYEAMDG